MKIAISGKGGVGKTTLTGILARLYADDGKKVLAVDADPDANLASALGIPPEKASKIIPLADMDRLIEERTGVKAGSIGGIFRLNPKVDDLPDLLSTGHEGVRLLVMGKSREGGSGCYCPENALLRRFIGHLIVERDEVIIVDMEAGIEHLTRGTARGVDAFIVVVEPGQRSLQTAQSVKRLAKDLGVERVFVAGNKIQTEEDRDFILKGLLDMEFIGFIPYDKEIVSADIKGISSYRIGSRAVEAIMEIKETLEKKVALHGING